MTLFAPLDIYCERTGPGLWAEPLGALSNLAFFVAAWMLWRLCHTPSPLAREGRGGGELSPRENGASGESPPSLTLPHRGGGEIIILILLIALVGLGSLLFHTFANTLTMLADVIPIGALVFYYFWLALRRLLCWPRGKTWMALFALAAAATLTTFIPDPFRFNGSVMYFPCLLAALWLSHALKRANHPAAKTVLTACAVLAVSLTFRSIDMALCGALPFGTHFLWHACNGAVLYLLAAPVIKSHCAAR